MSNAVLMCRIGIKYQYTFQAVCAYAHAFRKQSCCALKRACVPIRMTMELLLAVYFFHYQRSDKLNQFIQSYMYLDIKIPLGRRTF